MLIASMTVASALLQQSPAEDLFAKVTIGGIVLVLILGFLATVFVMRSGQSDEDERDDEGTTPRYACPVHPKWTHWGPGPCGCGGCKEPVKRVN